MNEKPDISSLLSMLSNNGEMKNKIPEEMLSTLMSSFVSSSHSENTSKVTDHPNLNQTTSADNTIDTNPSSNPIPDMEMMMKLMKIAQSSQQDSPSKDLLKSLKPFLNDSRKEKVDQYIKLLGMTKALEMFHELGDEPK